MVGANVIAADDDDEARRLFTSVQQAFANILRGRRGQLPPPIDDIERVLDASREGARVGDAQPLVRRLAGDGSARARGVRGGDGRRRDHRRGAIHDHAARLRSVRAAGGLGELRD